MGKKLRPILEIYEETAQFWDDQRRKSAAHPELKYMQQILSALTRGDALLDVGCGSGYPIAEFFSMNGIVVTGIDGAAAMIDLAKKKYPGGDWRVADMRTLELGRKFAAIVAWDSFFHLGFDEQVAMFPIFARHLRKGGWLLFTAGHLRGEAIGDMNGNPLFHASHSPDEYRALLEKHGFEIVSYHEQDPTCGDHTLWLARYHLPI